MLDQLLSLFDALLKQTGLAHVYWGNFVMLAVGGGMIYLAVAKK